MGYLPIQLQHTQWKRGERERETKKNTLTCEGKHSPFGVDVNAAAFGSRNEAKAIALEDSESHEDSDVRVSEGRLHQAEKLCIVRHLSILSLSLCLSLSLSSSSFTVCVCCSWGSKSSTSNSSFLLLLLSLNRRTDSNQGSRVLLIRCFPWMEPICRLHVFCITRSISLSLSLWKSVSLTLFLSVLYRIHRKRLFLGYNMIHISLKGRVHYTWSYLNLAI